MNAIDVVVRKGEIEFKIAEGITLATIPVEDSWLEVISITKFYHEDDDKYLVYVFCDIYEKPSLDIPDNYFQPYDMRDGIRFYTIGKEFSRVSKYTARPNQRNAE